jgi:hypothetical protein
VFDSSVLFSADEKLDLTEEVAHAYDTDVSAGNKPLQKEQAPGAKPSAAGK